MKKKLIWLALAFCLMAAACNGKDKPAKDASEQNTQEPAEGNRQEEPSKTEENGKEEENVKTEKDGESRMTEPSKEPEVTFTDYSQEIRDEENDVLLLSVTENCPVITIEGNEDISQKMNMVFEQQHITNQDEIEKKVQEAKDYLGSLPEEEAGAWAGYGYGMNYKVMYASPKILSIESENYDWQGSTHPNTWTSSYCFDVSTGDLLYLADVFTDEVKARKIVEQHILDTITKDPYKDALLDDYEAYVPDVMTENTFYFNKKGLVIICNPYMVTAYVAGTIEVEVPYEELKEVMNEKYII